MKTLLTILACLSITIAATAQDPSDAAGPDEAAMEAYMEAIQPGPHHAYLGEYAGTWTYSSAITFPDMPPMEDAGRASGRMIMGGRYLQTEHAGNPSDTFEGFAPFEGLSITAYDTFHDEYIATWIDNMGTGILVFRGQRRDDGALEMTGPYYDPMTKEEQIHRVVQRVVDDQHYVMEYYVRPQGADEYKAMEITYTRSEH